MNNPADKDGAWRFRFLECEISDWLATLLLKEQNFITDNKKAFLRAL